MGQHKPGLRVLVTGGAGYIGSHILRHLVEAGHAPVAFDNLYAGHRWAVLDTPLVVGDLGDRAQLDALLDQQRFDAVIHCAAHIWVGESVRQPAKYYLNNTGNALGLFEACARRGIRSLVFSSTAAVYGEPAAPVIVEDTPLAPINPYGASKMMAERALADIAAASGQRYAILRYFNVAGADAQARIGEATPDNSHLIKVACETAIGLRQRMVINGTDYPTPDGTCVRDYVHVADLAAAHVLALRHLLGGGPSLTLNLGSGQGASVTEVIAAAERATGRPVPHRFGPRRAGDPSRLVADIALAQARLGWQPRRSDLDRILADAWAWTTRR